MARRFIVKSGDLTVLDQDKFIISGTEVKHIQVLRHNIGDEIIVNKYVCKIEKITKSTIELKVISEAEEKGIPNINLTLYMAILKNDKMDYVVQKAVELGVKKIVPFFSNNVIVKLDEKGKNKRREKLQIIADEACKQCGRTDSVLIDEFCNFNEFIRQLNNNNVNILAYEKNSKFDSLKKSLQDINKNNFKNIGCIIGPEGGFNKNEVETILENPQNISVSLGQRILRAETAAISLTAIIMYEMD